MISVYSSAPYSCCWFVTVQRKIVKLILLA